MCLNCVPYEQIVSPGIGFDLTTSYASAAIRYHDGTVVDLVKIDGADDYQHLIRRKSDPTSKPECAQSNWDALQCRVSRAKRQRNKLLGRPSTPEVGTIAGLLRSLHAAVDRKTGLNSAKKALVSVPNLPGLLYEDLQDAMEYADLKMLSTHNHIGDKVSEVNAAFAGSSNGICQHYGDIDACEGEEAAMPVSHILARSLSQKSFSAAYTYVQAAYRSVLKKEATHFDLGLQSLPSGGENCQEEKALYRSRIRATIIEVGRASRGTLNTRTLLLLDEDADDQEFIHTVQDALRALLPNTPQDIPKDSVVTKAMIRST
ncbi:hypothetical protein G7Y79_00020g048810 [Physcia stellaris]|nr:hypothetical protein G7Y79_00020g048810 [Physcia stellaris]